MNQSAIQVRKLLRQQAAVAQFGSFALRESDLLKVLTEAARVCAESLGVPFAKVCRYRTAENDLFIEAGYGWKAGVIGTIESADRVRRKRAFVTGKPSICDDIRKETARAAGFYARMTSSRRSTSSSTPRKISSPMACWRSTMTASTTTINTTSIFSPALQCPAEARATTARNGVCRAPERMKSWSTTRTGC